MTEPVTASPTWEELPPHTDHVVPAPRRDVGMAVFRRRPLHPSAGDERVEAIARLLAPAAAAPRPWGRRRPRHATSYLPFPGFGSTRLLLPLVSPAAASAGLRLRVPGRGLVRRAAFGAAHLALRTGAIQQCLRSRVHLWTEGVSTDALADVLLSQHVSNLVGETIYFAIRVGRPDPHRTVTMHAVSQGGRLVAFVKVADSPLSCTQLAMEAKALERVAATRRQIVEVPRLVHHGHWNGLGLMVVAPMDLSDNERPTLVQPPPTSAMLEVASSGRRWTGSLAEGTYWTRTSGRLEALHGELSVAREAWQFAFDLSEGLLSTAAHAELDFGGWHGDWLPWNLGWHGGRLLAWDWEYWSDCVPIGFDMFHYFAGTLFFRDGVPIEEAFRRARADGGELLERSGFDAWVVDLVFALYVLEFLLRRLDISAHGGGVDDYRVFPHIFPVAIEALLQASLSAQRGCSSC